MGTQKVLRQAQNTGSNSIFGRWSRIGENKRTMKPKKRALWRLLTISTSLSWKRRPQSKTKERKIPKAFWEAMRGRGT